MFVPVRLAARWRSRFGLLAFALTLLVLLTSHLLQYLCFITYLMAVLALTGALMLLAPVIPGG